MQKGVVIGGTVHSITIRQKAQTRLEVGEVLAIDVPGGVMLAQVTDLDHASSLPQQTLHMVSGIQLEEDSDVSLAEPHLRYYTIARAKPLLLEQHGKLTSVKVLPPLFSLVRTVSKDDVKMLPQPEHKMLLGTLRSGSTSIDVPIYGDSVKMLNHHVLIAATTGRGKSNLTSCLLWELVEDDRCALLVLDPHDEYWGRNQVGLRDHPEARNKIVYYTSQNPPPGARSLTIHLSYIKPQHFNGALPWTDAQREALSAFYRKYKDKWIEAILTEKTVEGFHEYTIGVLKRRLKSVLSIRTGERLTCEGCFDTVHGTGVVHEIIAEIEKGKIVVIDTSSFSSSSEILIGSIFTSEIFKRYRHHKTAGTLSQVPQVSVVLEEAPRVLGKQVLERGPNIFSTVAREGRKFKVGLLAITQLPSLIPRDILANLNTKIILGLEMKPERSAIIESASQDLSNDDRHIASLNVGEAIVSSYVLPFATPIRIPSFKQRIKRVPSVKVDLSGMGVGT